MGRGKARVRLMPVRVEDGEDTIRTLKHAKRLRRSHVMGAERPKFIWTEGRRCVPAVIAG
jgi:hypothetical protein